MKDTVIFCVYMCTHAYTNIGLYTYHIVTRTFKTFT